MCSSPVLQMGELGSRGHSCVLGDMRPVRLGTCSQVCLGVSLNRSSCTRAGVSLPPLVLHISLWYPGPNSPHPLGPPVQRSTHLFTAPATPRVPVHHLPRLNPWPLTPESTPQPPYQSYLGSLQPCPPPACRCLSPAGEKQPFSAFYSNSLPVTWAASQPSLLI